LKSNFEVNSRPDKQLQAAVKFFERRYVISEKSLSSSGKQNKPGSVSYIYLDHMVENETRRAKFLLQNLKKQTKTEKDWVVSLTWKVFDDVYLAIVHITDLLANWTRLCIDYKLQFSQGFLNVRFKNSTDLTEIIKECLVLKAISKRGGIDPPGCGMIGAKGGFAYGVRGVIVYDNLLEDSEKHAHGLSAPWSTDEKQTCVGKSDGWDAARNMCVSDLDLKISLQLLDLKLVNWVATKHGTKSRSWRSDSSGGHQHYLERDCYAYFTRYPKKNVHKTHMVQIKHATEESITFQSPGSPISSKAVTVSRKAFLHLIYPHGIPPSCNYDPPGKSLFRKFWPEFRVFHPRLKFVGIEYSRIEKKNVQPTVMSLPLVDEAKLLEKYADEKVYEKLVPVFSVTVRQGDQTPNQKNQRSRRRCRRAKKNRGSRQRRAQRYMRPPKSDRVSGDHGEPVELSDEQKKMVMCLMDEYGQMMFHYNGKLEEVCKYLNIRYKSIASDNVRQCKKQFEKLFQELDNTDDVKEKRAIVKKLYKGQQKGSFPPKSPVSHIYSLSMKRKYNRENPRSSNRPGERAHDFKGDGSIHRSAAKVVGTHIIFDKKIDVPTTQISIDIYTTRQKQPHRLSSFKIPGFFICCVCRSFAHVSDEQSGHNTPGAGKGHVQICKSCNQLQGKAEFPLEDLQTFAIRCEEQIRHVNTKRFFKQIYYYLLERSLSQTLCAQKSEEVTVSFGQLAAQFERSPVNMNQAMFATVKVFVKTLDYCDMHPSISAPLQVYPFT